MPTLKKFAPSMQPNKASGVAAATMQTNPNTGKKVPHKIRRAVNAVKDISRANAFALINILILESTCPYSLNPLN